MRGIDTKVGLRMDVATRWNSTYLMLESEIRIDVPLDASLSMIEIMFIVHQG